MVVNVIDTIVPKNGGAFPVVEDLNVKGGYQIQPTTAARDAIVLADQKVGMLVFVTANSTYYQLTVTGTPGTWVVANLGGTTTLSGDTTGPAATNTVVGLQSHPISTTAPVDSQTLSFSSATNNWIPTNQRVANVTALRATHPITTNATIHLDGYSAIGDGGDGTFIWNSVSTLTGTFHVINGSPTVTASTSQSSSLTRGTLTFGSQPGVQYTVLDVNSAGTTITLSTNYLGTTNTATSAQFLPADNGGTVIHVSGITTGYWTRQFRGLVNILWFGAKGDNSTFNDVQWAAAVTAVGTAFGGNSRGLYVPAGIYLFQFPMMWDSTYSFEIAGDNHLQGNLAGFSNTSMLRYAGSSTFSPPNNFFIQLSGCQYLYLHDIMIDGSQLVSTPALIVAWNPSGPHFSPPDNAGLSITCDFMRWDRVYVCGAGDSTGIVLEFRGDFDMSNNHFEDCLIFQTLPGNVRNYTAANCLIGAGVTGGGSNIFKNVFKNCFLDGYGSNGDTNYALRLLGGSVNLDGCNIHDLSTAIIAVEATQTCWFNDNYTEDTTTPFFVMQDTTGVTSSQKIILSNNEINAFSNIQLNCKQPVTLLSNFTQGQVSINPSANLAGLKPYRVTAIGNSFQNTTGSFTSSTNLINNPNMNGLDCLDEFSTMTGSVEGEPYSHVFRSALVGYCQDQAQYDRDGYSLGISAAGMTASPPAALIAADYHFVSNLTANRSYTLSSLAITGSNRGNHATSVIRVSRLGSTDGYTATVAGIPLNVNGIGWAEWVNNPGNGTWILHQTGKSYLPLSGAISVTANIDMTTAARIPYTMIELTGSMSADCTITLPNSIGAIWYFDTFGVTLNGHSLVFTKPGGGGLDATITSIGTNGKYLLTVAITSDRHISVG